LKYSQKADVVAPLLGNRCCHGNRFMPRSLGCRPDDVSPRVRSW